MVLCLAALVRGETDLAVFLTDGWSSTSDARKFVDAAYPKLREAIDPAVATYAYSLALTRQRRYAEAGEACAEMSQGQPENWRALQLQSYLDLLDRNTKRATSRLLPLAEFVVRLRPRQPREARELVAWMGQMAGVVTGPLTKGELPAQWKTQLADVLAQLGGDEQQLFFDSQTEVLREFDRRLREIAQVAEKESAEDVRERAELQARLGQQIDTISSQLGELQSEFRQSRDAHAENRRQLEVHVPGAVADSVQLGRQEDALTWGLWSIDLEICRLDRLIEREQDPTLRRNLERQRDILVSQFYWDAINLDDTQIARIGADVRWNQLSQRIQTLDLEAAREQNDLQRRRTQLVKARTKAERQQARIMQPSRKTSGGVRSLRKQAESVSTYVEFPLELERQRLIRENR